SGLLLAAAKCSANFAAYTSSETELNGHHHHVGSSCAICCGSKTQILPTCSPKSRVPSTTSPLFEVVITAPGASQIAGTTVAVVLFIRGPAMTATISS